jgi:hypothetical protein
MPTPAAATAAPVFDPCVAQTPPPHTIRPEDIPAPVATTAPPTTIALPVSRRVAHATAIGIRSTIRLATRIDAIVPSAGPPQCQR